MQLIQDKNIGPSAIHERLEDCFEDMLARAQRSDWLGCDATWDAFASEIERAMSIAEERIFHVLTPEIVARLLADHAIVRRTLAELGVLVQLQAGHQAIVPAVEALREAARSERAALYSSLRSRVAALQRVA
jgi:hypothetical protein